MKTPSLIQSTLLTLITVGVFSSNASANTDLESEGRFAPPVLLSSTAENLQARTWHTEDDGTLKARSEIRKLIASTPIRFGSNSTKLGPVERRKMRSLVLPILLNSTSPVIVIEGHSDLHGSAAVNDRVALERANQARDYLIMIGVPASDVQVRSAGARRPLVSDKTPAAGRVNRRVDLLVQ